jgi:hypothetical protein
MNGSSSICPCDAFVHPRTISNPVGRNTVAYRVGDYTAFREALLRSIPGEVELQNWHPTAQGDLAVQMMEWWAYLADILTFYNERIANQDYLRTANLPESVRGLIAILGYRPRPGIGAKGVLGALMTGNKSFTLPQGFQIQSKPGPRQQPQVFELNADTLVQAPDSISADPPPGSWVIGNNSVLLQGTVGGIKQGDELLVLQRNWMGQNRNYAIVTVSATSPVKDPRGKTNTGVLFNEPVAFLASEDVKSYRLLRSLQSSKVWQYPADVVIASNKIDLASITRGINVGDPVLLKFGNAGAGRGIFYSPDGKNLGGGGNTQSVAAVNRTVVQMITYQSGVLTAFDDGTIYFSPDGQNLGGGGQTKLIYAGPLLVVQWIIYHAGVMTAFSDGTIYFSPDGNNLAGGGQTTQQYGGPYTVSTLIAYQTGVIVSFNDGNGSVYHSPDGTNLYGGGATQYLVGGVSGYPPESMIVYGANLITVWPDYDAVFLSNGLDLTNQSFPDPGDVHVTAYGSSGVITAVFDNSKSLCTIYYSTDGSNLMTAGGNTSQVYRGPNNVVNMISYSSGVLVAFDNGTIFYSPDGNNLGGNGNTVQVFGPGSLPVSMIVFNNGVITAFPVPALLRVTSYSESVWYANGLRSNPGEPPSGSPEPIAIPIPHTEIGFTPALSGSIIDPSVEQGERSKALLRYAWQDVGTLIASPATSLTGAQVTLTTPLPSSLVGQSSRDVLVSDANGSGVEAKASAGDPSTLGLSGLPSPLPTLVPPLNVLFNVLAVSRGQTVSNEVLGSGDATINTGQSFTLQKSPLTYLQDGAEYKSTLRVWVDGVEWKEVPSFYGQSRNARVFVTSEDNQNMTHVQFGDGVYGARLPSGTNNVVATYRYGSGATSPDAGSLSVILKSWPGLKSILNPVPAGGGADPDPPQQIKTYAPQSVLTFGRAISTSDYEAIAAEAPGVSRARAYWSWDPDKQRNFVKIYVGDNANAVSDAHAALAGADDPNRPVSVIQATPVAMTLGLTVVIDPSYQPATVLAAVTAALIDPDAGLLGANVVQIGQIFWQSQIYQVCQSVPGVAAARNLLFARKNPLFLAVPLLTIPLLGRIKSFPPRKLSQTPACDCEDVRSDPGEGGYFQVAAADFNLSSEVAPSAG